MATAGQYLWARAGGRVTICAMKTRNLNGLTTSAIGYGAMVLVDGMYGEVAALRDGECDVAFVWLPADLTGLRSELVASEQRYAGLASGHRLAARAQLSVNELNDEPIMWTRLAPRYWVDWWAVNPRPDGSEPRWGPENDNVEEMLEQVADGSAYCIAPASMTEYYARPDLAWVPITDIDPLRIALAWRERDGSPLVAAFAGVVRELVD